MLPKHIIALAECATRIPNASLAQSAVDQLLLFQLPPSDILCRMLCVQGWVKASLTSQKQGAEGVNCLLQAINYLIQAMDVATSQEISAVAPQLVYNVSVVYWNITRRMVRKTVGRHNTESFTPDGKHAFQSVVDEYWHLCNVTVSGRCIQIPRAIHGEGCRSSGGEQ